MTTIKHHKLIELSIWSIYIFTGRNEVVAKVMFLHVCVILFTGGGGLRAGRTPPEQTPPSPPAGRPPPSGKQTPAYGQRAAGTHPTGMHSCNKYYLKVSLT